MKIVKKNVYYCEFCDKHGLSSYHIRKHERGCTKNPDRKCGFCGAEGIPTKYKIVGVHNNEWDGVSDVLTVEGGECPACVLAFVRKNLPDFVKIKDGGDWDYKKAVERWWAENSDRDY